MCLNFLKLKDKNGNPLTLYESDYAKLYTYLKDYHIDHFTDLTIAEKLFHLENVRLEKGSNILTLRTVGRFVSSSSEHIGLDSIKITENPKS